MDATEPAAALPVVLVHGLRLSGSMWGPVADGLRDRRAVAAPDLPGHGSRRTETFSLPAAVQAVVAAIDGLDGPVVLVGASLGGYVAIGTAARHPERVAAVVAVGCTAVPGRASMLSYRAIAPMIARDRFSERAFRRMLPPQVADAMMAGGLNGAVVPDVVRGLSGWDVLGALGSYPGPVWLVNGEWDHFRRNEHAFASACVQGRLMVWPRCHHVTCLADTVRLQRTIGDVCDAVEAQRARR